MPNLSDIVALLGLGSDAARPNPRIDGVATLAEATPRHISFVATDAYLKDFQTTRAAAVIVQRRVRLSDDTRCTALVVDDVELAISKVLELFDVPATPPPRGVSPDARIDPSATLGEAAAVGRFVVVGGRTTIGRRCTIHDGVHIAEDVVIGDDCVINPNVVIRQRVSIGNRVSIHAGAVIGSDGFGYRWDGSRHRKVPHIGTVIIEDDVEIGSCTCIDRAKFGATRIGRGTKIDNLVQVAHHCTVGPNCIIAGQVGLAGSVTLGAGVMLGGQTAISDHLRIGDAAMVAGRSAVATDIDPKARVSGMPALPHRQTLREQGALRRLPEMITQIKKLEEEIAALKQRLNGS